MSVTPDQQLKEKIIEAIKKEGLLKERNLKKLEDNYLSRGISIDDWNMSVESQIHDEEVENARRD